MNEKDWKTLVLKHKLTDSPLIFGDDYNKCEVIGIDDKFDGAIEIPNGVLGIRPSCFEASLITDIVIPDTVNQIGNSAFRRCYNLESVHYSSSIGSIPDNCFSECWKLRDLSNFDNVSVIGNESFSYCYELTELSPKIFPNLYQIGKMAFLKSHLEVIIFGDTVRVMYHKCFERCDYLKYVNMSKLSKDVDCKGFDFMDFVYNNSKYGCKFVLPCCKEWKLLKDFLVEV